MNALDQLFNNKKENLLAIYFTVGFPDKNSLSEIICALNETETDIIEIGLPFSDPMADGEIIQHSSKIALQNGMNIHEMFKQLSEIKNKNKIPLVIMTYFNPVFKYGVEKFCEQCKQNSVSGLIIPDLPLIEYQKNYKALFENYRLKFTPLVSPTTREERMKELFTEATGFIYMVSGNQITGVNEPKNINKDFYADAVLKHSKSKPVLMGFGINSSQKYKNACDLVNGGIIGSAYIQLLEENKNQISEATKEFISTFKSKNYDYSIA